MSVIPDLLPHRKYINTASFSIHIADENIETFERGRWRTLNNEVHN
jgi:hypothetical protein